MSFISDIFFTFLHQPLANGLIFLYNTIALQDLGIAIVLITIVIRVVFFPLFHKSARQQTMMQKIQPRIKEIQKKYKKDPQKQAEKMMALYKDHDVNPFSSILFLLIQLPFLFALYRIFLAGFTRENFADVLYSFVHIPEMFNHSFLGLINLNEKSILIVSIAAIAQYIQGKLAMGGKRGGAAKDDKFANIGKKMVLIGPILTLVIFYNLPAAVGVYWLTTSIFSIIQQVIVNKTIHDKIDYGELENNSNEPRKPDGLSRQQS